MAGATITGRANVLTEQSYVAVTHQELKAVRLEAAVERRPEEAVAAPKSRWWMTVFSFPPPSRDRRWLMIQVFPPLA